MPDPSFMFRLVSPEIFEPLDRLADHGDAYIRDCEKMIPQSWKTVPFSIWVYSQPPNSALADSGWKIHLSGYEGIAAQLLKIAVALCVKWGVAFKFVRSSRILRVACAKFFPREAAFKFLTAYPDDLATCKGLANDIHSQTRSFTSAYILTDRHYLASRVVYLRYGSFRSHFRITLTGTRESLVRMPNGDLEADRRFPWFTTRSGVESPFDSSPTLSRAPTISTRYVIQRPIKFTTSGGTYQAVDKSTKQTVVLKEGRPFVDARTPGAQCLWDAADAIRYEYRILAKLQHLGYSPRPVDLWRDPELGHVFLAEEFLPGVSLTRLGQRLSAQLFLQTRETQARRQFTAMFMSVTTRLLDIVAAIHGTGVIIGDWSPDHIIVDPRTFRCRLIDFEGATETNGIVVNPRAAVFTPGMRVFSDSSDPLPSELNDYSSLARVLTYIIAPITPIFDLAPEKELTLVRRTVQAAQLPNAVTRVIELLREGQPARARELAQRWHPRIRQYRVTNRPQPLPRHQAWKSKLRDVRNRIADYLLVSFDAKRTDRLWPTDYVVFQTNPLSIAYGACGPLLFLKTIGREIPEEVYEWLRARLREVGDSTYPPGLYMGLAGVAYVLNVIGWHEEAGRVLSIALNSPLAAADPTVLYGLAGLGIACVDAYSKTGNKSFLSDACLLGHKVAGLAMKTGRECYWDRGRGKAHFGIALGASGIALFLLHLYAQTQDKKFLRYAQAALRFVLREEGRQRRSLGNRVDRSAQGTWFYGSAGTASVLSRFAMVLHTEEYAIGAKTMAEAAFLRFAANPGQFIGLSGVGECMIDLWRATRENVYLERAQQIAERVLLYAIVRPSGLCFPDKSLSRLSTCFAHGSSGVGLFLHRLVQQEPYRYFHDQDFCEGDNLGEVLPQ